MSPAEPLVGLPAAPGMVAGRAMRLSVRADAVPRRRLAPADRVPELARWSAARQAAIAELQALCAGLGQDESELAAVLEVHLLLLQDEVADAAVREQIREHGYNAEWALQRQLEETLRPLVAADDAYLRGRAADVEQAAEHVLRLLMAQDLAPAASPRARAECPAAQPGGIVVARDLSPADLLRLRRAGCAGLVTDVGGVTGHTAIVARSMGIPAVVAAASASGRVRAGDELLLDGNRGRLWINPSPAQRDEFNRQRAAWLQDQRALRQLGQRAAQTLDGVQVALLANIEQPPDCQAARAAGAAGIGLFRTEFLFMGRAGRLPDEDEQFAAYRQVAEAMAGAPVTIRSVDVGADKPLGATAGASCNPALGLRAIRWSLAEPEIFLVQLRAILRAAMYGNVRLLVPLLSHASQIHQTLALLARARAQLEARGLRPPPLPVGAMIEVPAAALMLPLFLRHFDFLSIGTNDLAQYTLAVDRADADVAGLLDPLHPAVLRLIADTIAAGAAAGKPVAVCGELAGDPRATRLLLGLGLRQFSMHAGQMAAVKREILRTRVAGLAEPAQRLLNSEQPAAELDALG